MDCPRCLQRLHGEPLARCVDHGVFVPQQALQERAAAVRRFEQGHRQAPSIKCPDCGDTMHATTVKRVEVDMCACGGVWLDGKEEKLLRESWTGATGKALVNVLDPVLWLWP